MPEYLKMLSRSRLGCVIGCLVLFSLFNYFHLSEYIFGKQKVLAGGLRGGISEAAAKYDMGEAYKVVEEKRTPETPTSKSTVMLRVDKAGITGCRGILYLDFYDNKLYSTRFYPEDMGLYLAHIQDTNFSSFGTYNLSATPDIYRDGIHVWLAKDSQGRTYAGWEDTTINRNLSVENTEHL